MLGNTSQFSSESLNVTRTHSNIFSIQEAVSRLQEQWYTDSVPMEKAKPEFGLANFNIGPPIAKGCAAVVYAAALKTDTEPPSPTMSPPERSTAAAPNIRQEMMSPIQNTSRFLHNFGGSVDNLHLSRHERSRFYSINEEKTVAVSATGAGKKVRFNTAMNLSHHQTASNMSNDDNDSIILETVN